jgi:hypothetical protein
VLGGVLVMDCGERPAHHARVDHDRRGGAQDPLGEAAALPFFNQLDQSGLLELLEVVVHPLPGQLQCGGQLGRRRRLPQQLQQLPPDRRQRDPHGLWFVDVGLHATSVVLTV